MGRRSSSSKQPQPQQQPPEPLIVVGGKYVGLLEAHLKKLRTHPDYAHGNRRHTPDRHLVAYLLAFFNPTCRSLRAIEDFSRLPAARERLGADRVCRSTISDANALFDPALLDPLVERLRAGLPPGSLRHHDRELERLLGDVVLVDGSFFAAAADVSWAIHTRNAHAKAKGEPPHPKVRLDLHLDGRTLTPRRVAVHGRGTGEPDALAGRVERGAIYVLDRGYVDFGLIGAVLDGGADLVLRLKEGVNFEAVEVLPPDGDGKDHAAGVLSDRVGHLPGSPHCEAPDQQLREVVVLVDPSRPEAGVVRLLTSLLDVPAHVIAALYRWRWQVELFFRWLKVHAHFRHLTSHSQSGMTLGFYVAVIAVLLMYLHLGRAALSKYAYNLLALVASGWGGPADVLPILEARMRERENDRRTAAARAARKKAEKTAE